MSRRKTFFIQIVIAFFIVVFFALAIIFIRPFRLISSNDTINYVRIYDGDFVLIEEVDTKQLGKILTEIKCMRKINRSPFSIEEDLFEISLHINGKPMHVILGAESYCYYSGSDFIIYEIVNGEEIYEQICVLLK